jgi:hypothetical protein
VHSSSGSACVGDRGLGGGSAAAREEARAFVLAQPVALAADVEHVAIVKEPVEDRRGDDGVAEPAEAEAIARFSAPC